MARIDELELVTSTASRQIRLTGCTLKRACGWRGTVDPTRPSKSVAECCYLKLDHDPNCRSQSGSYSPPFSSSPPSSVSRSTDATFSPSPVENTMTPCVERPAMRIPSTGQRMSWPPSVTSMI